MSPGLLAVRPRAFSLCLAARSTSHTLARKQRCHQYKCLESDVPPSFVPSVVEWLRGWFFHQVKNADAETVLWPVAPNDCNTRPTSSSDQPKPKSSDMAFNSDAENLPSLFVSYR